MNDTVLITRALHFAAERHSNQRRKGRAQEPYINHLAEVAELVGHATEGKDANLVVAALLHDTIEDTATLPEELASIFNRDVAELVQEVTDDKSLTKKSRKDLQITNAPKKSRTWRWGWSLRSSRKSRCPGGRLRPASWPARRAPHGNPSSPPAFPEPRDGTVSRTACR